MAEKSPAGLIYPVIKIVVISSHYFTADRVVVIGAALSICVKKIVEVAF